MTTVAILFWAGVFLVFYTYLGYGILPVSYTHLTLPTIYSV